MLKIEAKNPNVEIEAGGSVAEILTDFHIVLRDVLEHLEECTGRKKERYLTNIYQRLLKEWSEEK